MIDLSEVQDFSMSSSKGGGKSSGHSQNAFGLALSAASGSSGGGKGHKLDSMLSKLMKKNNVVSPLLADCRPHASLLSAKRSSIVLPLQPLPVEEAPVVGKEKKKRKLDEIVLGLCAAQEQKMYPDPMLPTQMHSGRKPQITPSVSVTPANVNSGSSSSRHDASGGTSGTGHQKPFTITVTSVPAGSGSAGSSAQKSSNQSAKSAALSANALASASGLAALQNMAGLTGASSKELSALFAEAAKAEQQAAILKQHQKFMQQFPANSPHRKSVEAMYNEVKQAADLTQLYRNFAAGTTAPSSGGGGGGSSSNHEAKVNKWLAEQQQQQQLQQQIEASIVESYRGVSNSGGGGGGGGGSRGGGSSSSAQRATRQQQQQQQQQMQQEAVFSRHALTGDESVPVIHKVTGKRVSGNKVLCK